MEFSAADFSHDDLPSLEEAFAALDAYAKARQTDFPDEVRRTLELTAILDHEADGGVECDDLDQAVILSE